MENYRYYYQGSKDKYDEDYISEDDYIFESEITFKELLIFKQWLLMHQVINYHNLRFIKKDFVNFLKFKLEIGTHYNGITGYLNRMVDIGLIKKVNGFTFSFNSNYLNKI